MPRNALIAVPLTYAALRQAVETVVHQGRQEIDRAWLQTYHETGRLINEHLRRNQARAGYGAQVVGRLAEDTGISRRTLHECAQFQRCFPIVRPVAQLTWNHYRLLCQIENEAKRVELLQEAVRQKLSSPQLVERVRVLNALEASADPADGARDVSSPKPLVPRRGTPGVCKVIEAGAGPVVDLGFASYRDLPAGADYQAGDFVRVTGKGLALAEGATKADLFTYTTAVLKVVDGDTLWVKIYLELGRWVKQKLRLRDLDCPEMSTAEGRAAKRLVDGLIARTTGVTICTTKPDKYDRYLADVFLTLDDGREVYLNNELLANGHAVPKKAWEFGDWGEA